MTKWQAIGPISVNLESNELTVDNVGIRRFSKDELCNLLGDDLEYWSPVSLELSHYVGFWLKMDIDVNDNENSWEKPVTEVQLVLEALGLFKTTLSMISMAGLCVKKLEEEPPAGGSFGLENTIWGTPYWLSTAEYNDFSKLLTEYRNFWGTHKVDSKSSEQLKRINLAKNCFVASYQRPSPADRYILLSIALEALYGEAEQELAYRYSNRAALLLGDNADRRKEACKDAKSAYRLRSSIVHGGVDWIIYPINVWKLAEIIRETILRCISLFNQGYANIGSTLDDCIHEIDKQRQLLEDSKRLFGKVSEYKEPEEPVLKSAAIE
jgi:hypothetical protein